MDESSPVPPAEAAGKPSSAYVGYVLATVLVTMAFSQIDRSILSILVEDLKLEFQLNDTQISFLLGPAFALVYAMLVLPIGRYADTTGVRRDIIAASLFFWSLFTGATAYVGSYAQLALMRMGVGVGEAGGSAPSISMLSDYLPPERRARGLSVVSIGAVLGLGIGMVVGGYVNENHGWRAAFLAVGIPGVLLSLLFRLTIREPVRGASEGRSAEALPFWTGVKELLATRSYLFILAANGFTLFASMGRNLWEPAFLMRTYQMDSFQGGVWYFLTSPLPSVFGIFLGGFLADRLGRRDPRWLLWVPALGLLMSPPLLVAFLLWPESQGIAMPGFLADTRFSVLPVALLFSVVGSIVGSFFTAPFMSATQGVVPLRMRAFAAAVSTLLSTLIGQAGGPVVVGILADRLEPTYGVHALRYALLVPTLIPILGGLICLAGAGRVTRDLARSRSLDTD